MLYGKLIIACQLKIQASTVSSITTTVTRQVIIRKDCDAASNLPTASSHHRAYEMRGLD